MFLVKQTRYKDIAYVFPKEIPSYENHNVWWVSSSVASQTYVVSTQTLEVKKFAQLIFSL